MSKKQISKPLIKIIRFAWRDIIATSRGTGNGNPNNPNYRGEHDNGHHNGRKNSIFDPTEEQL